VIVLPAFEVKELSDVKAAQELSNVGECLPIAKQTAQAQCAMHDDNAAISFMSPSMIFTRGIPPDIYTPCNWKKQGYMLY
jgi:hypothetical protein